MSKTTEIQIEKSRNLIEGLRRVEKDSEGATIRRNAGQTMAFPTNDKV